MNIYDFFTYDKECFVCQNTLQLYMQFSDGTLWKASYDYLKDYIEFKQFKCKKKEFDNCSFFLTIKEHGLIYNIDCAELNQKFKTLNIFFFSLCNKDSFEDCGDDYYINPYLSCYYRSSNFMEVKQNSDKEWSLQFLLNQEFSKINNVFKDEIFTFKKDTDLCEKIYILNMDYENNQSILKYYTINKDKSPSSIDFDKTLPLPSIRPNFDIHSRNELIDKFDTWILLS